MRKQFLLPAAAAALTMLAAPAAFADYSNTVMSFNPAGYWRLNETTPVPAPNWATNLGTAGISAYGSYQGSVIQEATGALVAQPTDTAATFSGGRVAIGFNAALNPNGPFSVECWANKTTGSGYPLGVMSSMSTTVGRQGWLLYDNGSSWTFRLGMGASYMNSNPTGGTADVGSWYHLVGVFDGVNSILYVNGVAVDTQPISAPYQANPDYQSQIGTVANPAFTRNFAGTVDEVAIYTNALSAADILAHYQNGISASPTTPYQQLVLSKNPVAYYRLNEKTYVPPDPSTLPQTVNNGTVGTDATGTNYPGVSPGMASVPYSGFGAGNLAYGFDGFNGWVDLGNPDGLNISGTITLAAWIKPQATDGLRNIISHGYSTAPNGEVQMRINGGRYEIGSWDGTSSTGGTGFPMPAGDVGRWTFLAGTYDGAQWNLYWNGILMASNTASIGALQVTADWAIGARGTGTERFFSGEIDEAAIYTNALTTAQIQQIFYAANVPPIIVQQPKAPVGTVYEGSAVNLTGLATGNPTLAYQWTKNGTNLTGKTTTALALSSVVTNDSGNYALVVTNSYGAVTSSIVALAVISGPPLILQQPQSATRFVGTPATFSVTVGGSVPYSYQWMYNTNTVLSGATSSSYTISSVQLANAGTYSCIITNPYGSSNTVAAVLSVIPVPPGYPSVVMGDHPIAYWRLGESTGTKAGDYAGGHDGVYNNATLGQPGYSLLDTDTAATFGPGLNSYVGSIQGITFAGPASSATFSLEFWTKGLPSQQIGDGAFICKGTGGGGEQFCIDGYHGTYRFYGSGAGAASSTVPPDGTWQHVVGVCDGPNSRWQLYVNGVLAGSGSIPTTLLTNSHEITIAARQSGSGAYDFCWNSLMDEVAIYNTALSDAQIAAHYNARYGNNTPPLIRVPPAATTGYAGQSATLSVVAEGTPPLTYQWQKGANILAGEVNPTLTLSPLDLVSSPGTYTVAITGVGTTNASASVTVLAPPSSLNLTQALVLHLPFGGDYQDYSGRGNNATPKGAPTFVAGPFSPGGTPRTNAVAVNVDTGSSTYNYVSVSNSTDLAFGVNDSFTISFWVSYNSWANDDPFIGNAVGSTYQLGWVLCDYTGKLEVSLASTGNSGTYIPGPPLPNSPTTGDGAWHHVVLIVNRATQQASAYVDGAIVNSWDIGGMGTMYYNNPITIGNDPTGSYGATGGGSVGDVGAWRRALTPLEISGIYVAGISNGVSFAPPIVALNWKRSSPVQLSWPTGVLQSADKVTGPYTDVSPAPSSPYTVPSTTVIKYYRVRIPN